MATMVEQRAQPLAGYEGYDRIPYNTSPHFTNPWGSSSGSRQLYNQHNTSPAPNESYNAPSYNNAAALGTGSSTFGSDQDASTDYYPVEAVQQPRAYAGDYHTAAPTSAPFNATSSDRSVESFQASYNTYEQRWAQYQQQQQQARKQQFAMKPQFSGRDSFNDALDGAQGMVAMSQQDCTPRANYQPRNNSTDSYGFPSTQSEQGSVSSGSSYPYYGSYTGSVDGSMGSSVTDYSSASEDMSQRTLPPPGQMISGFPADASQMMSQFNSKLAASAQKKHKCKICDKRFTRPSSLQTHMYSHTGEKPFSCDFDGCGRHFSVVSNLRRHKKCHKGGSVGDADSAGSPETADSPEA